MTLEKYKDASGKTQMSTSPAEVYGGVVMEHDEPKTTKGNPGTPATATMSTSSSMTMTSTSSTSSATNAAGKVSAGAFLPPLFAGMSLVSMCGYLA